MEQSIVEAVAGHARRAPERSAMLFEGATLSYGQLYADVERFARALLAAGLTPGERVALFLENCPAFAVAYLGAHLAGGVVTLVNSAYRQVELSHIFTDADVRICVTSPAGAAALAALEAPALRLIVVVGADTATEGGAMSAAARVGYAAFLRQGEGSAELRMPAGDAPASIGYTSGTTGRSKGALLLHRNQIANTIAITTAWRWSLDDRLLLALPLFHSHGLGVGLHSSFFMGSSVLLHRKFDASATLAAIAADPLVSVFFGVPTMYARLIAAATQAGAPTRPLRLYVSGSAPLPS
ncbi:MAG TPA: class I adenylate-forming enzyme family protein, partial [Ktedonobacterales bacterium]